MNTRAARERSLVHVLVSLALFVPLWLWIYRPASNGLDVTDHTIGRDFINLWAGTRLAFSGQIGTLFDLEAYTAAISAQFGGTVPPHAWSYPPNALALFWPFAQLPYFASLALWTIGWFAAFGIVALAPVRPDARRLGLVLLIVAPASLINAAGGQNGFLTAALFLGGVLLIDRRPVAAGVLFGLLTFKPQLGLVLPLALIALRAWRTIVAAVITAALLLALSLLLFGIEPWKQYVEVTAPFHVFTLQRFRGFYTTMMSSVLTGARTFGIPYPVALALQVAVAVPVLAAAAWAVRRTADPCRRAFVLATAAPLVTPYAFNYDLTAVAAGLVWILCGRLPTEPRWRALYLLAWAAPVAMMYLNMVGLGVAPLVLIGLFALALREAVRHPVPSGDADRELPRASAPARVQPQ